VGGFDRIDGAGGGFEIFGPCAVSSMSIDPLMSSDESSASRAVPADRCPRPISTGGGRVTAFFSAPAEPGATIGGAGEAGRGGGLEGAEPSKSNVEREGSGRGRSAAVGMKGV
jgi:hypothetical protein